MSVFIPKSKSIVSFNALKPVISIKIETSILMYPSIVIPKFFDIIADTKTTIVEIASDILSYAFPFIAVEFINLAIFF